MPFLEAAFCFYKLSVCSKCSNVAGIPYEAQALLIIIVFPDQRFEKVSVYS